MAPCHRLSLQRVSAMQGLKNEMCGLCSNLMLNNPRVLYDKYSKIPDAATVARLLVRTVSDARADDVQLMACSCDGGAGLQHIAKHAGWRLNANLGCLRHTIPDHEGWSRSARGGRHSTDLMPRDAAGRRKHSTSALPRLLPWWRSTIWWLGRCSACRACSSKPSSRCRWVPSGSLKPSQDLPLKCL